MRSESARTTWTSRRSTSRVASVAIRVTPKAGADEVTGLRDGELQVRVRAAAEGGKATASACRVVAGLLGIPKSRVRLLRGASSRHKLLEIEGVAQGEVDQILEALPLIP